MKLFIMVFLSVFLSKSCENKTQNDFKTGVLEYTANTRGFYQKISIKNQMVTVSKERGEKGIEEEIKILDADWKELLGYFEGLDLDGLATLKAPTEKRFYDGAAIANLKITLNDKTYETAAFDHGFPPVEIKKLVDKINSFAQE